MRDRGVDVAKGLLTLAMVLTHIVQLLGTRDYRAMRAVELLTDLAAFPGFLLCFGFAMWMAYLSRPRLPLHAVIRTGIKCYLAYVVSGFAFRVLINGQPAAMLLLGRIAFLQDLPDYSEFLFSFALITLLATIFRSSVERATRSGSSLALACLPSALLCLLHPAPQQTPFIGELIGGLGYKFFPVLTYLPVFLSGVFIARHRPQPSMRMLLPSLALLLPFALLSVTHVTVERFPPSLAWLLASVGIAWISYITGILACRLLPGLMLRYLDGIGHSVLFYLLASNLIIFIAHALRPGHSLSMSEDLIFYAFTMAVILLLRWIIKEISQSIGQKAV